MAKKRLNKSLLTGIYTCLLLAGRCPLLAADGGMAGGWGVRIQTGPFQKRISRLMPGETLRLKAGVYHGPIEILAPQVVIQGEKGVVIEGNGKGTVIWVKAPGVTLRNLTVRRSGQSNPDVDAGVSVQSQRDVVLQGLRIHNTLFGIDIGDSQNVLVKNCTVQSMFRDITLRGDAIRVWSSNGVTLRGNHWRRSRDAVVWYSRNVLLEDNHGQGSRYSVHSMYSENVTLRRNFFRNNQVGIFLMYGQNIRVVDNDIRQSTGASGIGLGLKETSGVFVRHNTILDSNTGILVDNSPWHTGAVNRIRQNTVAFNATGILLANDRPGNFFEQNVLKSNTADVDTESRHTSPGVWNGNYWDSYEGFDRNHDKFGDTPHAPRKYGDLLTGVHPSAMFFRGSPVLLLINLIERLVPITEPLLLLEVASPRLDTPTLPRPLQRTRGA